MRRSRSQFQGVFNARKHFGSGIMKPYHASHSGGRHAGASSDDTVGLLTAKAPRYTNQVQQRDCHQTARCVAPQTICAPWRRQALFSVVAQVPSWLAGSERERKQTSIPNLLILTAPNVQGLDVAHHGGGRRASASWHRCPAGWPPPSAPRQSAPAAAPASASCPACPRCRCPCPGAAWSLVYEAASVNEASEVAHLCRHGPCITLLSVAHHLADQCSWATTLARCSHKLLEYREARRTRLTVLSGSSVAVLLIAAAVLTNIFAIVFTGTVALLHGRSCTAE